MRVICLENLRDFAITFGLHLQKRTPVSFTINTAVSRIQEVYDFDCHGVGIPDTRSPTGTVSTVVLEDEKNLLALKELRDLLNQYAPPTQEPFDNLLWRISSLR